MTEPTSILTAQNIIATASSYGQNMATNNTNAISGGFGQAQIHAQRQMQAKRQKQIQTAEYDYNPNQEPSWKIPLSELITLWRAKFGDVWVDVSDLEEVFWYRASMRLSQNKLFEEGDTRDSTPWVRLKEDV